MNAGPAEEVEGFARRLLEHQAPGRRAADLLVGDGEVRRPVMTQHDDVIIEVHGIELGE